MHIPLEIWIVLAVVAIAAGIVGHVGLHIIRGDSPPKREYIGVSPDGRTKASSRSNNPATTWKSVVDWARRSGNPTATIKSLKAEGYRVIELD